MTFELILEYLNYTTMENTTDNKKIDFKFRLVKMTNACNY